MSTLDTYSSTVMGTYATPPIVLTRGEGVYLWDESGKRYLDLLAGIACVGVGHANPQVAEAIANQARTLGHVSNLFATAPQVELAKRLTSLLGHDAKVFFTNSGTEANEAGFKLTRLTGKTKIVAAEGSFHGRTMGSLALTWTEKYRAPFEPLPGDVVWVPYGDAEALRQAVDCETAAILIEPFQGESGIIMPPDGYLVEARRIADENKALLWFDEIQSGMGRTGAWFAHTHEEVVPDIVTLAKALANGFPIGAVLATGATGDLFTVGLHGTTFGGNPLACSAALATLDQIEPLLDHVTQIGTWLMDQLRNLPEVSNVRGRGLAIGVCLQSPIAAKLVESARHHGIILNAPRENVIRLVPPLIVTQEEVQPLIDLWPTLVKGATHG